MLLNDNYMHMYMGREISLMYVLEGGWVAYRKVYSSFSFPTFYDPFSTSYTIML